MIIFENFLINAMQQSLIYASGSKLKHYRIFIIIVHYLCLAVITSVCMSNCHIINPLTLKENIAYSELHKIEIAERP